MKQKVSENLGALERHHSIVPNLSNSKLTGNLVSTERQKLQDLQLAEASARSGMSVGALKVATHRAMATLKKRFGVAAPGDTREDR